MKRPGGLKIIPVQFQTPAAEALLQPLGERTSMGLLWAFMGVSPAYTVFAGLGETLGGLLLFWRRTALLGSLIVAAVMANVVMLNFAYDVPVKRAAALLFLASLVLLSRDAPRLARVLLLDRSREPGHEPSFAGGPGLRRTRAVLKPAIVLSAAAGPIAVALALGASSPAPLPLRGVYEVERFVRDGVEVPPLLTESRRWRRLVLDDRGQAVVQTMDDRFDRRGLALEEATRTITLSGRSGSPELRFRYEELAGERLRLSGEVQSIAEVTLHRLPEEVVFRVLRGRW